MTDSCCCPPEAGNASCELSLQEGQRPASAINICPVCSMKGKPVQGQTVKALLSVSLREVQDSEYFFCKTRNCSVVYFSPDGEQFFTVDQVRETVYQKEPDNENVFACYCFQHKVGEIRAATLEVRSVIIDDINKGIRLGQCACDLRNPQGSCCLGNVRGLVKEIDVSGMKDTTRR